MISVQQYLEAERAAEFKHEFCRGRTIGMAGGSPNHAQISMSIGALIWNAVKGKGCKELTSDARIAADRDSHYC
jgi:Putative restriction endonuclease